MCEKTYTVTTLGLILENDVMSHSDLTNFSESSDVFIKFLSICKFDEKVSYDDQSEEVEMQSWKDIVNEFKQIVDENQIDWALLRYDHDYISACSDWHQVGISRLRDRQEMGYSVNIDAEQLDRDLFCRADLTSMDSSYDVLTRLFTICESGEKIRYTPPIDTVTKAVINRLKSGSKIYYQDKDMLSGCTDSWFLEDSDGLKCLISTKMKELLEDIGAMKEQSGPKLNEFDSVFIFNEDYKEEL